VELQLRPTTMTGRPEIVHALAEKFWGSALAALTCRWRDLSGRLLFRETRCGGVVKQGVDGS